MFPRWKTGTAVAMLVLMLLGMLLSLVGVGFIVMGIVCLWALIDAFLIPGWIRNINTLLATSLTNSGSLPQ